MSDICFLAILLLFIGLAVSQLMFSKGQMKRAESLTKINSALEGQAEELHKLLEKQRGDLMGQVEQLLAINKSLQESYESLQESFDRVCRSSKTLQNSVNRYLDQWSGLAPAAGKEGVEDE